MKITPDLVIPRTETVLRADTWQSTRISKDIVAGLAFTHRLAAVYRVGTGQEDKDNSSGVGTTNASYPQPNTTNRLTNLDTRTRLGNEKQ